MVVTHVHHIVAADGVVHSHVDYLKVGVGCSGVYHNGSPGRDLVVPISPAVDERVFDSAVVAPKLDPIAEVIRHDTTVDAGVSHFRIKPVPIVMFGDRVNNLHWPR
ncbi:hypothetical protein ES703_72636 [subsurface metagenome]